MTGFLMQVGSEAVQSKSGEWCLGLPLEENRPLSPTELAELRAEASTAGRRAIAYACAAPACLAIAAIFCNIADKLRHPPMPPAAILQLVAILLIGCGFFGLVIGCLIKLSDGWHEFRCCQGDVKTGFVKHFAAHLAVPQQELENAVGIAHDAENGELAHVEIVLSLDVLPSSRRLWKKHGEAVVKWTEVTWSEVAEPSEFAATAAAWVAPLSPCTDTGSSSPATREQQGRRDLTAGEKAELQRRVRHILWQALLPAVLLAAWFGIPLLWTLSFGERFPYEPDLLYGWGFPPMCVGSVLLLVFLASRLRADWARGQVIILRVPVQPMQGPLEPEMSGAAAADAPGAGTKAVTSPSYTIVLEILPVSRRVWTRDGNAAQWRRVVEG